MGATEAPYMYQVYNESPRFSGSTFDPKAVTRASWQPKPPKPKRNGPFVKFNEHPDAQMVLTHRSTPYTPMSPSTKSAIKWLRWLQLVFRILELNGAIGILGVFVLLDKIETAAAWVLRITPGIALIHCAYAIYHLARPAGGRAPTSSAAYHIFATATDVAIVSIYAYSAFTVRLHSATWTTRLPDQALLKHFIPAVYYTLMGSGGVHVASACLSVWLTWAFRKISLMPPDMNPLEDHLTARPMRMRKHKRNKSSMTASTTDETDSMMNHRRQSMGPYDSPSRPSSVPFMHTREGSHVSIAAASSASSTRIPGDVPRDLPSRQYQIIPANSPRNSRVSVHTKRTSHVFSAYNREISTKSPSHELPPQTLNPRNTNNDQRMSDSGYQETPEKGRTMGKFTETWAPTNSLISRTNEKNRTAAAQQYHRQSYSPIEQQYDINDYESDTEYHAENGTQGTRYTREVDLSTAIHPNPLRSNPPVNSPRASRASMPLCSPYIDGDNEHDTLKNGESMRYELTSDSDSENDYGATEPLTYAGHRVVSISQDITDQAPTTSHKPWHNEVESSEISMTPKPLAPSRYAPSKKFAPVSTNIGFYSKPYGDLKSAAPPIIVGNNRNVSSGNDFESKYNSNVYGRRAVSGKVAEEGRAGDNILSRYGFQQYTNRAD